MRINDSPRRELEAENFKLQALVTDLTLKLEQSERERRRWYLEAQALANRAAQQAAR